LHAADLYSSSTRWQVPAVAEVLGMSSVVAFERRRQPVAESILVRVDDAAALLQLSRSKTYALINEGELVPIRFGRAIRLRRSDVEALVERRQGGRRDGSL
jgi:excisionase family DNA binding protein